MHVHILTSGFVNGEYWLIDLIWCPELLDCVALGAQKKNAMCFSNCSSGVCKESRIIVGIRAVAFLSLLMCFVPHVLIGMCK